MVVHRADFDPDLLADLAELHDDEEEDLVGADWHQTAIRVANEGLLLAGPERGLPWHVGNQLTTLMGRIGTKEWRPCPDLSVHPTAGHDPVKSFDTRLYGPPLLVIEVASESTWHYDVEAKRRSYGRVGVQEYLVFDPTQEWLGEPVRAWRATPRGLVPWAPGRDGCWHSRVLGISFEPEGMLLRVIDQSGERMPHVSEQARRLRDQARTLDEQTRTLDEQARRLAALEAEIRRLRGDPE